LITGAFADRVTFKSYLIFLVFWSILVYLLSHTGPGEAVSWQNSASWISLAGLSFT